MGSLGGPYLNGKVNKNMIEPDELKEKIIEALAIDGMFSFEDVIKMIVDKKIQYFENDDGCMLTEIRTTANKRWLVVLIAAGNLPGVFELRHEIFDFAKRDGCSEVRTTARPGWSKLFKEQGWHIQSIEAVQEII